VTDVRVSFRIQGFSVSWFLGGWLVATPTVDRQLKANLSLGLNNAEMPKKEKGGTLLVSFLDDDDISIVRCWLGSSTLCAGALHLRGALFLSIIRRVEFFTCFKRRP
jgi:hypothetical protein